MSSSLEAYGFFRKPGWRHQRIVALLQAGPEAGRCTHRDDTYVREGRRAFIARAAVRDSTALRVLTDSNPGVLGAIAMHEAAAAGDVFDARILQARLLSGQTPEQIAEISAVSASVAEWYGALFFDVSSRLDKRDWVLSNVLMPALKRESLPLQLRIWTPDSLLIIRPAEGEGEPDDADGDLVEAADAGPELEELERQEIRRPGAFAEPFFDRTLKFFAYYGGPYVLEPVLHGVDSFRKLGSGEEFYEWCSRFWRSTITRRSAAAAMTFEVNRHNVMELFQIQSKISELDKVQDTSGKAANDLTSALSATLQTIQWRAGTAAGRELEGTEMGEVDSRAAEAPLEELIRAGTATRRKKARELELKTAEATK